MSQTTTTPSGAAQAEACALAATLTDELTDRLAAAALAKSRELGIDITFAVADAAGNIRLLRRYGDALPLSLTLVPAKAYTAAICRMTTRDLASAAAEGSPLMGLQSVDRRITLVAGGVPLTAGGRVVGAIGVGGGSQEQDCLIADCVVEAFRQAVGE